VSLHDLLRPCRDLALITLRNWSRKRSGGADNADDDEREADDARAALTLVAVHRLGGKKPRLPRSFGRSFRLRLPPLSPPNRNSPSRLSPTVQFSVLLRIRFLRLRRITFALLSPRGYFLVTEGRKRMRLESRHVRLIRVSASLSFPRYLSLSRISSYRARMLEGFALSPAFPLMQSLLFPLVSPCPLPWTGAPIMRSAT